MKQPAGIKLRRYGLARSVSRRLALWPAFVAVVLLAFGLRFYRLADHPLGLFFDPAINGLDAIRLIERGGWVIFFPTNGGREGLFMVLLIPLIQLFGAIPFSPRLLTALMSLLTVVLLFAFLYDFPSLVRSPFYPSHPHPPQQPNLHPPQTDSPPSTLQLPPSNLWLALLGGLALGASYWHVAVSRLAQRPIMVPLVAVPIFWFFLKGWAGGRRRWFVLSGLGLGLAGYTYPAARLLPLILVLTLLPEFIPLLRRQVRPAAYRSRLVNLALLVLVALLVYLPMAWYLLTHPAQFTARAGSVMVWNFLDTPGAVAAEIGRNGLRVLGFFCCAGSPNPIFGLPGRPGLSPLLAPLLLVGLAGALWQWRSPFHRLVVLAWVIGLLPSVVAIEAPHPWRLIVALVPTTILVALAPLVLARLRFGFIAPWLALLLILATLPGTFRAYFIDWTDQKITRSIYDYNAIAIRDRIFDEVPAGGRPIYLPLSRFNDSTLLFYLSGRYHRQAALAAPPDPGGALVISPDKNAGDTTWVRLQDQSATVLPPLTPAGQAFLQAALAASTLPPIKSVDGEPAARQAHLDVDPAVFLQQPARPITATIGPARLLGASYPVQIDPAAGQFPVTLFWEATGPIADELEVLLHLVDDSRRAWGQGDARPTDWVYPTTFWRPGRDQVAAEQTVKLEAAPPPGRYWLAVALFNPATGQRLPLGQGSGESPDTLFLGPLKVPLPPALQPNLQPINADFGEEIRLAGLVPGRLTVKGGEPASFSLVWQAITPPRADYTVFVHLLDPAGSRVTGHDSPPLNGSYPTTLWAPGERVVDPHTLPLLDDQGRPLAPGRYRLAVGLYHQPTGARLPLRLPEGGEDPEGRFILEQVVTVAGD